MGETVAKDPVKKKNWYKGLNAEFKKIIWPDKQSIIRQTVAVVAISVALGAIIKVLDMFIQMGINFIA